jgi:AcrR family transcriptional regulator
VYGGVDAQERRSQRRERLVEAAFTLFSEQGYASTTIQQLADTAGCALRTFYEEFGSREALIAELYDRVMASVMERTLAAVQSSEPRRSAMVRAGVDAHVAAFTANRAHTKVALIEVVAVSAALDKHRRETLKTFTERLVAITESKAGRAENPAAFNLMFLALTGAAERLITEWVLSKGRVSADQIAQTLGALWLTATKPM